MVCNGGSLHHIVALAVARISGVMSDSILIDKVVEHATQLTTGNAGLRSGRNGFLAALGNVKQLEKLVGGLAQCKGAGEFAIHTARPGDLDHDGNPYLPYGCGDCP